MVVDDTFPLFTDEQNHTVRIPHGSILVAYRGSIAHGMYVPESDPKGIDDIDLMGAVVASPDVYIGLGQWGSRGTIDQKDGRYDSVFYEIRKLANLLLQGNPNVLSLLWTRDEDILYITEEGKLLRDKRGLFRGKHVYNAFSGYAYAQLKKMETRDPAELREYLNVTAELKRRGIHPNHKGTFFDEPDGHPRDIHAWGDEKLIQRLRSFQKKGENIGYMGDKRKRLVLEHGFDPKNAAHLIRLLRMGKEFLETGELQVYRSDAAELLDIKRGKWKLSTVKEYAEDLFEQNKVSRDESSLPDGPDRDGVERVVMDIIRTYI